MVYVVLLLLIVFFLYGLVKIHNIMCKNSTISSKSFSLNNKDLEDIIKIKKIISSKINDDYKIITRYDFESIDLFEQKDKGYIKTYNNDKLVRLIKKAINEIKNNRQVYIYGRCDTVDIFFVIRNTKISNKKICNHCGFHISYFNSKYIGISETTGEEYECGNCGKTYDTGPIDQWNRL